MKKFLSLPAEKQNRIVTAAMTLFGEVGYNKAYISEIASAANISKALIFHYFASKKGLYAYLVYYTGKIVMTEAQNSRDTEGKDFFERALITIKFRLTLKSRYPAMNSFIDSVFNEQDEEVAADIERLLAIATDMHAGIGLLPGEEKLFKSGALPQYIVKLVDKYAEGVVNSFNSDDSVDETAKEVAECLNMLKSAL